MRGVQELEPTKFDKWNIPTGQLDLNRTAMARSSEQDRLLFQHGSRLSVFQDALDDKPRLVSFIAHTHQLRLGAGSTIRPEVLGKALSRQTNHAVGGSQDGLCRAVVAIKRNDVGRRIELA